MKQSSWSYERSSKYSSNKEGQIAAVNALVTANDKADVKIKRQSEHGFQFQLKLNLITVKKVSLDKIHR